MIFRFSYLSDTDVRCCTSESVCITPYSPFIWMTYCDKHISYEIDRERHVVYWTFQSPKFVVVVKKYSDVNPFRTIYC